jgi:hypothetical protein
VGGSPSGWYDSGANNSLSRNDALFAVTSAQNRALATSSTAADIHSHYTAPGTEGWANYEFRGRMMYNASAGGIGVTVYSQYPEADAYYRILRSSQAGWTAFRVGPHPAAQALTCRSETTGVLGVANTSFQFRVQVLSEADQTVVRAKIWPEGTAEPAGWQVDCDDRAADRLTQGRVGLWASGSGTKYWDDLAVIALDPGDPGEEPPPPAAAPDPPIILQ